MKKLLIKPSNDAWRWIQCLVRLFFIEYHESELRRACRNGEIGAMMHHAKKSLKYIK